MKPTKFFVSQFCYRIWPWPRTSPLEPLCYIFLSSQSALAAHKPQKDFNLFGKQPYESFSFSYLATVCERWTKNALVRFP